MTGGIREARKLRAELITEVAQGKHGTKAGTFGALLDEWLKHGKRDRAPSTLTKYRQKIDGAIPPALGSVELDKMTAKDLDTFYGQLQDDGKSTAMVMEYHRIISAALRQAEKWDLTDVSMARKASPPQVTPKPMTVPPPDRVKQLIDAAAKSKTPELATFIIVAALTGMRRGELCGLRWSDVDWQTSALTVNRSVWQNPDGTMGTKLPKTHQIRRLVLGEHTMAVLAGRKTRVDANAAMAEVELANNAYVFSPTIDGAKPIAPDTVPQAFNRLCHKMEDQHADEEPCPYRLHDLRHYTATELFRAGHHARTVADRLGHADPALTMRVYTHNTEDQAIAAAASLEAGIAG